MSTQTRAALTQPFTENSDGSNERSLANLKPFKPGQSGNPGGRPKGIVARSARRHLRMEVASGVRQVDCMVDAQIQKAIADADTAAFIALRDTADGRPRSNDDGDSGNITSQIIIEIVGIR